MTFRSRQLADLMTDYFEAAWRDAITLKDFEIIEWSTLNKIAKQFGWKDARQPPSDNGLNP